jgi:hypothetical protein
MKTSELTGYVLDRAVMRCEGLSKWLHGRIKYSSDWAEAGPIIEREEIGISRNAPCSQGREWEARPSITAKGAGGKWGYGPAPLIAAMRCYVASKLGDEIDVPVEWMEGK